MFHNNGLTMKLILFLTAFFASNAFATLEVYDSSCAMPTVTQNKWYFDPVNGDDVANDGSQAKPWKTLQSVFTSVSGAAPKANWIPYWHNPGTGWGMSAEPKSPIHPGDALELMTGNYGVVQYGLSGMGIYPSDWLTIEGVAGQSPVLQQLKLTAVSKLYVRNVKIQAQGITGLIYVSGQGTYPTIDTGFIQYPTQDVVIDHVTMNSSDDVSTWTKDDWNQKVSQAVELYPYSARCVAITNATIKNVSAGFGVTGEKIVIAHNTLDHFTIDAVDFAGNFLKMHHNILKNSLSVNDYHRDFFQGQIGHIFVGYPVTHYHDVVIDSNLMIGNDTLDKTMPYGGIQGIDTFDMDWTNMTYTNNTIITSSCWGIGAQSVHTGEIAHNTVLSDHILDLPCKAMISVGGTSHQSLEPTNLINVHHNLADGYSIDLDHQETFENNVCHDEGCPINYTIGGKTNWNQKSFGTNLVDKEFVQFLPKFGRFNTTVLTGSLADKVGAGSR